MMIPITLWDQISQDKKRDHQQREGHSLPPHRKFEACSRDSPTSRSPKGDGQNPAGTDFLKEPLSMCRDTWNASGPKLCHHTLFQQGEGTDSNLGSQKISPLWPILPDSPLLIPSLPLSIFCLPLIQPFSTLKNKSKQELPPLIHKTGCTGK